MDFLPDGILENVFEFLYEENLKSCFLTCLRFQEIIVRSTKLMTRLPLVISEKMCDEITQALRKSENVQEIIVQGFFNLENVQNVSQKVKMMSWHNGVHEAHSLEDLMNCADTLKQLDILQLYFKEHDLPLELKQKTLKNLNIEHFQAKFFSEAIQSENLVVNFNGDINCGSEKATSFIQKQNNLKSLEITGLRSEHEHFFKQMIQENNLQLDKLAFNYCELDEPEDIWQQRHLASFLRSQNTLKSFSIKASGFNDFWPVIVEELKMLEKLDFNVSCFSQETYLAIKELKNVRVRELTIHQGFGSNSVLENIFQKFPNVRKFHFLDNLMTSHLGLKINLPRLDYFQISYLHLNEISKITGDFKKVRTLIINNMLYLGHDEENKLECFKKLVEMFPNLRRLKITRSQFFKISTKMINLIMQTMKQLNCIELGGELTDFDVLRAISKCSHDTFKTLKCERNQFTAQLDVHAIFKDTNLLVFICDSLQVQ